MSSVGDGLGIGIMISGLIAAGLLIAAGALILWSDYKRRRGKQ